MKNLTLSFFGIFMAFGLMAQNADWVELMHDPNTNFYTVKQSFDDYWKDKEIEKGKGYKQFMRWAHFWEPRVYPEGNFPNRNILALEYEKMEEQEEDNLGLWKPLGPFDGSSIGSTMGIGRVNRVVFDPTNHQIVYACTPAGGLWKSVDGGVTWETNTDLLPNLGVSDLAINPLNPDVMYMATGDRNAGDTYSYGVLKTTDGGITWNPTDLSFSVSFEVRVQNVYVSPMDTNVVLAATSGGIYRSADGGTTFTVVDNRPSNNLVQKIGNPNILFSALRVGSIWRISRSTDAGITWNVINDASLPQSNAIRIELAVTPADTNYVYAVIGASNYGLEGVYRSVDGGTNWSQVDNGNRNLLGWNTTGSDVGGQAWYDLAIAASPTNKNEVYVGGVNIWRSTNGGVSWNLAAHWFGGGGAPFVHADIHHLTYQPVSNLLYTGTDGGVYRDQPNQFSWDELNDGMNITQYYKLSAGSRDTVVMLGGAQDNGSHRYNSNGWSVRRGGDGMDNAINPKSPNVMYASSQYGNFAKSLNGGNNFSATFNLPPGVNGSGGWVTPIQLDPQYPDTLYIGYNRLYRSYNGGVNFTAASPSNLTGGQDIDVIAIAPNHTNVIFIAVGSNLWKSTNRGGSWSNLSANVPGGNAITYLAVDYTNPDHLIMTRSRYSPTNKVLESYDGGLSWTSIGDGLPNVPANCVVMQNNPEKSIYVGTDLGVFYRDSLNPKWIQFNAGLPNVIVSELEINYNNRKLRAATYGRGMWESPLYSDLVAPEADAVFPSVVCAGDTVQLFDNSNYNPNYYRWYIEPPTYSFVNGTNDTMPNPHIVFGQTGFYNISLVASNAIGSDSAYLASAVAAGGLPLPFHDDLNSASDLSRWNYEETTPGWEAFATSKGMSFRADLYNNSSVGAKYALTSPALNLTAHDSAELSFEYAYSGASANTGDSLLIYAAGNCSDNWVLVGALGEDGNNSFVTAPATSNAFDPAANEWCGNGLANCVTVSLQAFSGQEGVRIRFIAVNAGGNHLYLDNISVTGKPSVAPVVAFSSASQVCAMDSITFSDQTYGSPDTYEWTFTGPVILTSNDRSPRMLFTQAGQYDVKLKATNVNGSDSVIKTSHLLVDPADSVNLTLTAAYDSICPGDDLNFTVTGTQLGNNPRITWHLNGQVISGGSDFTVELENLIDGDQVYVSVRSSLDCAFPDVAISNVITVHTYPVITPQVNIPNLICSTDPPLNLSGTPAGGIFTGNGVVNGNSFDPAVAGTGSNAITYTVTGPNGCVFTTTKYVGVAQPINLNINGNATSCENGDPVSLTVGQPAGGQYSGPGVYNNMFYPDSVAGTGIYSLTYSYFSSICGTTSKDFDMSVYPAPNTPGIIVYNTYLECDITASAYQWYDANGAIPGETMKTYSPSMDGQYRVEVSDNRGCQAMSTFTGYYIGLKDLPAGFEFNLYPNPAKDQLHFDLEALSEYDLSLSLYDQVGNLILSDQITLNGSLTESLNISELAAGVYLFALEGEQVNIKRKVIIE
jgi:photosystem II stability/assembly factor-like uncharacterized protein/PKD repeat protein